MNSKDLKIELYEIIMYFIILYTIYIIHDKIFKITNSYNLLHILDSEPIHTIT